MNEQVINHPFLIMTLILSENQYNKIVSIIKERDIRHGMMIIGRGTVKSAVLNLMGIKIQKKIVVSFLIEKEKEEQTLDFLIKELQLDQPGHGIVYTTSAISADRIINNPQGDWKMMQDTERDTMFDKITVIVNRGMAEEVMDIARKAGVTGGTILHGRGTASELSVKLLGMEIEPEKELVMILTTSDLVDNVVNSLYNELQLDNPGNGILFVEPVLKVHGLFNPKSDKKDT